MFLIDDGLMFCSSCNVVTSRPCTVQKSVVDTGADPGFCEGGFEQGFVDSLKGTFEQK